MNWEYKLFKKMNAMLLPVLFDFGYKKEYAKKKGSISSSLCINSSSINNLSPNLVQNDGITRSIHQL